MFGTLCKPHTHTYILLYDLTLYILYVDGRACVMFVCLPVCLYACTHAYMNIMHVWHVASVKPSKGIAWVCLIWVLIFRHCKRMIYGCVLSTGSPQGITPIQLLLRLTLSTNKYNCRRKFRSQTSDNMER